VQNVSSVGLRKKIYYKDWSTGPIVTFSHGWPLNADACSPRVVS
jgi:non-heme chloroperoxidase